MKFKRTKNILGITLIILCGICFVLTSIPFVYGIRNIGMIIPMMIFLLLGIALAVCRLLPWRENKILRVTDDMILIGASLFMAVITVISLIMCFGFTKTNGNNISVVIVPGAKIHGDTPSVMLGSRLDKAVELLEKNENAVCIVSGGQGADEQYTEAYVMKKYLEKQGIVSERLFTEEKSENTKQNFAYSAELIKRYSLEGNVAVTTDFYHSYRCVFYAKLAGITASAYPCSTERYLLPAQWAREIFAVLKAYVLD